MVRFICAEIALALDFLKTKNVVHRDVKPDNILLDEKGHAHLTDFNVAAKCESSDTLLNAFAGTKPYMAPEIFRASSTAHTLYGYSFAVDWWSLGITAYELKLGLRPFDIGLKTSVAGALQLLETPLQIGYPPEWSPEFTKFIHSLLSVTTIYLFSFIQDWKAYFFSGGTWEEGDKLGCSQKNQINVEFKAQSIIEPSGAPAIRS